MSSVPHHFTLMGVLIASLEIWYHFSTRMLSANTILAASWKVNPYNKQMEDWLPARQFIDQPETHSYSCMNSILFMDEHMWMRNDDMSSKILLENWAGGILGRLTKRLTWFDWISLSYFWVAPDIEEGERRDGRGERWTSIIRGGESGPGPPASHESKHVKCSQC